MTVAFRDVVPGWGEALRLMVEGEKRRVWLPKELASKAGGATGADAAVVVDLELQKIAEEDPL